MNALILNGCYKDDPMAKVCSRLVLYLLAKEKITTRHIILANTEISGCVGCLNCFFKTPGECGFNDIGRKLPLHFINSELAIFISPVIFGGFSSLFAKAYNRMVIQLESHMGETINGELRRRSRYKIRHPVILAIGLMQTYDPEVAQIFVRLIKSNTFLHLHSPKYDVLTISSDQSSNSIEQQIQHALTTIRS